MFGAMHFNYYINRSMILKVDSTYLGIDQQHITYMSLTTGGREPVILRSQNPTLTRHRHTSRQSIAKCNMFIDLFYLKNSVHGRRDNN